MKKLLLSGIIALSIISCKQKETELIEAVDETATDVQEEIKSTEDTSKLTFNNYKVSVNSEGKKSKLDFTNNPDAKNYRTSINEVYNQSEINFAGNYIVTTFGCGQGCISGYIVDTRDGKMYDLPDTEDDNNWEGIGNDLEYKPNSSLLITKFDFEHGYEVFDHKKYWFWNENNKKFELIKFAPNYKTLTPEEYSQKNEMSESE